MLYKSYFFPDVTVIGQLIGHCHICVEWSVAPDLLDSILSRRLYNIFSSGLPYTLIFFVGISCDHHWPFMTHMPVHILYPLSLFHLFCHRHWFKHYILLYIASTITSSLERPDGFWCPARHCSLPGNSHQWRRDSYVDPGCRHQTQHHYRPYQGDEWWVSEGSHLRDRKGFIPGARSWASWCLSEAPSHRIIYKQGGAQLQ